MHEFERDGYHIENIRERLGTPPNVNQLYGVGMNLAEKSEQLEQINSICVYAAMHETPIRSEQRISRSQAAVFSGITIGHYANGSVESSVTRNLKVAQIGITTLPEEATWSDMSDIILSYADAMRQQTPELEAIVDDGISYEIAEGDINDLHFVKSMSALGYGWARGINLARLDDEKIEQIISSTDVNAELERFFK